MTNLVAWSLFVLGFLHILFGLVRYRSPLAEAARAGFIGQFNQPEIWRTAFWFIMCGPFLMLTGYIAVHAVTIADLALLQIIGVSIFVSSLVGVLAFPKSPLWVALVLALLLIVTS